MPLTSAAARDPCPTHPSRALGYRWARSMAACSGAAINRAPLRAPPYLLTSDHPIGSLASPVRPGAAPRRELGRTRGVGAGGMGRGAQGPGWRGGACGMIAVWGRRLALGTVHAQMRARTYVRACPCMRPAAIARALVGYGSLLAPRVSFSPPVSPQTCLRFARFPVVSQTYDGAGRGVGGGAVCAMQGAAWRCARCPTLTATATAPAAMTTPPASLRASPVRSGWPGGPSHTPCTSVS